MIPEMTGRRVTYDPDGKLEVNDFTGYYLKVDEIAKLCRDFACDCMSGFVSNDKAYIELKLKEM
jgi:hypothetical protein